MSVTSVATAERSRIWLTKVPRSPLTFLGHQVRPRRSERTFSDYLTVNVGLGSGVSPDCVRPSCSRGARLIRPTPGNTLPCISWLFVGCPLVGTQITDFFTDTPGLFSLYLSNRGLRRRAAVVFVVAPARRALWAIA